MNHVVALRRAGTAVLLDVSGTALPRVLHWGSDPGLVKGGQVAASEAEGLLITALTAVPNNALDQPVGLTVLPTQHDGWLGTPAITGDRSAVAGLQLSLSAEPDWLGHPDDPYGMRIVASDPAAQVEVTLEWQLDDFGVLRTWAELANTGCDDYRLAALRQLLPLPSRAQEVLDLTGRWCRERFPQRSPLQQGTHLRSSRRGRTGHDATLLMSAGTPGFGFRHGEVWACHVAWSGNHEHLVDCLPEGLGPHSALLGGGELLAPGEVVLAPGGIYRSPTVVFVWSDVGLDGLSARLYSSLRARPNHPSTPRPVVINTWEAVYFETDLDHLKNLVDVAASIGVERFVLDDGWFGARRHDRAGLGDWTVSADVWPQGMHPLVNHVRAAGLQVGLWFEPEMVNLDSDLVRAHPDWVLGGAGSLPKESRQQQVLDIAHPPAFEYLREAISAVVAEYSLDYLKWDHNRDLHEAYHRVGPRIGRPAVHDQTLAIYALLDALRERHPGLEIESCSSGGARIDLGILERTDRVWASDCNDSVERQAIQRWTGLLLPPELMGSHVGPPTSHTTGRVLDLSMRAITALFCHAGLEWDITTCSTGELAQLRRWIELYKELRGLLHSGAVVRADLGDSDAFLHGVVAHDGSEAVYSYVRLQTAPAAHPGRVTFPGLDANRQYRVRIRREAGTADTVQRQAPAWLANEAAIESGVVLRGSVLEQIGLPLPVVLPAQALLLHLRVHEEAVPQ